MITKPRLRLKSSFHLVVRVLALSIFSIFLLYNLPVKQVMAATQHKCDLVTFSQTRDGRTCYFDIYKNTPSSCLDSVNPVIMTVSGLAKKPAGATDWVPLASENVNIGTKKSWSFPVVISRSTNSVGDIVAPIDLGVLTANTSYSYWVEEPYTGVDFCRGNFYISDDCTDICEVTSPQKIPPPPYKVCAQIPERLAEMKSRCEDCIGGEEGMEGIWTAIGCIPRDPETIVSVFIRFGLGMGGGVALLMILGAGFMLTISQGDPKQTDTAKQWLTSAISGLLFIIFSITILQFIGYNIFQIPGFGG